MNTISETGYVDQAEAVIKKLNGKVNPRNGRPEPMVTTSKLRNLLAMTDDIYNEILTASEDKLSEEIVGRISYLRMRFVYEAGREPKVKDLVTEAKILEILKEIGNSKKNFILFTHYMEALVAFHKFYGGKD